MGLKRAQLLAFYGIAAQRAKNYATLSQIMTAGHCRTIGIVPKPSCDRGRYSKYSFSSALVDSGYGMSAI